jgi:signal transduction histidine kinase
MDYEILKNLIENLTSGILIEDHNRLISRCNDTFREMFDITKSNKDLIGLDCGLIASKSFINPDKFLRGVNNILKNRTIVLNDEVYLENGKILERDYIPITIPVRGSGEDYIGHCWHYRDITDKKKISRFLRKTANDSSYILSNIAHEINNPLNGIIGLSDLMLSDSNPVGFYEDIKLIKQAGNDIKSMVDILLNKKNIKEKVFNIEDIILKSYNTFKNQALKKKIFLTYNLLSKECKSKDIYITQIINNLINNAIKYTKSGGVHINTCINPCKKDSGLGTISIEIIDSGIGISKCNSLTIFKPFSQLDSNCEGIGLGLHMSEKLINKIRGGSLKYRENKGNGSTFTLKFEI